MAQQNRDFSRQSVFTQRLGVWAQALCEHGQAHQTVQTRETGFGTGYFVEGELNTPAGRPWRPFSLAIRQWTIAPRLAYPL